MGLFIRGLPCMILDLSVFASQPTMNAMRTTSPIDLIEESNNSSGSDSDASHDDSPEYYELISAIDDDDGDADQDGLDNRVNSDEEHRNTNLSNGYNNRVENGILSLNVSDVVTEHEEEEEEEEEEERTEASDTAFREEERRRNAPLTPENATRVREAMRGVSFGGFTPDWANQIPEDRWIDQIRRLRQPQSSSGTV